jgi:hypothetical protein
VTLTGYIVVAALLSVILISSRKLWITRTRDTQRGDVETQHR